jgi:hypothetical protein
VEVIRAVFDWQPGEHAEVAEILVAETRVKRLRVVERGGWVVAAGLAALILFRLVMGDLSFVVAMLPWLLFVVFWVWIYSTMAKRRWGARLLPPVDHRVDFPFIHTFSDTGLRVDVMGGATELHWSGMVKAREVEGFFLFFWNDVSAHFTPKRALSIEDQNRLRALIQEKLGDRADVRDQIEVEGHRADRLPHG